MKAEKKPEGFVIYSKSLQSALLLPDEQAGRVLKAAARLFLMDEAPEELELSEEIVMSLFKGDIEDSINHHAEVCARNQRIAANRKAPSVTTHDESLPVEPNRTEIESNRNETNIIESKKEADKPPRATRFTPPSVKEVEAYCAERRNSVDPQRFVDFYASKGWKVGSNTMKDWRAAVRTWEARKDHEAEKQTAQATPRMNKTEQYVASMRNENHKHTAEEMEKLLAALDKI